MKKKNTFVKGLSFIIMLCLLLQMIPMEALAVASSDGGGWDLRHGEGGNFRY